MDWDMVINIGMFGLGCSFIIVATAFLILKKDMTNLEFNDEHDQNASDDDSIESTQDSIDEQALQPVHWYDANSVECSHISAYCELKQWEVDHRERFGYWSRYDITDHNEGTAFGLTKHINWRKIFDECREIASYED